MDSGPCARRHIRTHWESDSSSSLSLYKDILGHTGSHHHSHMRTYKVMRPYKDTLGVTRIIIILLISWLFIVIVIWIQPIGCSIWWWRWWSPSSSSSSSCRLIRTQCVSDAVTQSKPRKLGEKHHHHLPEDSHHHQHLYFIYFVSILAFPLSSISNMRHPPPQSVLLDRNTIWINIDNYMFQVYVIDWLNCVTRFFVDIASQPTISSHFICFVTSSHPGAVLLTPLTWPIYITTLRWWDFFASYTVAIYMKFPCCPYLSFLCSRICAVLTRLCALLSPRNCVIVKTQL